MPKFRKKPVVIEAVQFIATREGADNIRTFAGDKVHCYEDSDYTDNSSLGFKCTIKTLEGEMEARSGDWIIKGVKGEFYPCKPDIFEATYEPEGE